MLQRKSFEARLTRITVFLLLLFPFTETAKVSKTLGENKYSFILFEQRLIDRDFVALRYK